MAFNFIAPISKVTGLPPVVFICSLVIILFLIVFGILILIKVRSIIIVLNRVNNSLDSIVQRIGKASGDAAEKTTSGKRLGSAARADKNLTDDTGSGLQTRKIMSTSSSKRKSKKSLADLATVGHKRIEPETNKDAPQGIRSEEHAIRRDIGTKIYELLKKFGKPIPYNDLTKQLSKEYPGYDYDYFIKAVEGLQKEEKVEVQLVAGKLYFQVKQP